MRIRKQFKLAGLSLGGASSSGDGPPRTTRLQSHICHLNQSPWDVISFPPDSASSPYQFDGEDSFTANGSFGESLGAVESVASMKISAEMKEGENVKSMAVMEASEKREKVEERERVGLCCKTDGKGWQCKKESSKGHSLCDHHLTQLRTYNSLANPSGKKSEKPTSATAGASGNRRRPRPRKSNSAAAANPYEFYYYSGFGPRWGKKRGTANKVKIDEVEEETAAAEAEPTPSSSSQFDTEELDYVDDDDDDDEVDVSGKRRTRKPIKARSLKSLM